MNVRIYTISSLQTGGSYSTDMVIISSGHSLNTDDALLCFSNLTKVSMNSLF